MKRILRVIFTLALILGVTGVALWLDNKYHDLPYYKRLWLIVFQVSVIALTFWINGYLDKKERNK